jgi:hypothetical protein
MHGKDDGFIITAFLTKRIKQIGGFGDGFRFRKWVKREGSWVTELSN